MKRNLNVAIIILCSLFIGGCGTNAAKEQAAEMAAYKEQIDPVFDSIKSCNDSIESIDPSADDAEEKILSNIDDLCGILKDASAITPPVGYEESVTILGTAYDNMTAADEKYHAAFESKILDGDSYEAANEYYNAANSNIKQLVSYLRSGSDESDDSESEDGESEDGESEE